MQTITPDLAAILKDHFQAAADGHRARLDVSTFIPATPATDVGVVQIAFGSTWNATFPAPVTPGHTLVVLATQRTPAGAAVMNGTGWNERVAAFCSDGGDLRGVAIADKVVVGGDGQFWESLVRDSVILVMEIDGEYSGISAGQDNATYLPFPADPGLIDCGGPVTPDAGVPALVVGVSEYGPLSYATYGPVAAGPDATELVDSGNGPHGWMAYRNVTDPSGAYSLEGFVTTGYGFTRYSGATAVYVPGEGGGAAQDANALWTPYTVKAVSIDKSLRVQADQAEVTLANEGLPLGWGPTSIFRTNQRIRIYQWYGDVANAVRSFTGIIDKVRDGRDILTTTLSCRDLMGILIDETFSAIGPQGADEDGAIRTVANGVYLSMEVSDIVYDIVVTRCGWPVDDVDITPTSYVLDEFVVSDGQSWASAIIGDTQLTGLVGYSAWADEAGVFHFAPTLASNPLTDPEDPVYTYRSGEDVVSLEDETDQYELITRIKARGPLTTTTLTDTWIEQWRTSKLHLPVGIYYRPTDPTSIRVIDRGTKRMYRIRQSDRAILSSVYLGGPIPHPLGLSGDPADSTHYWVLNAPWIDGGASTGNSIKKVRFSDNAVVATYAIPNGRWSAIKASSSFLWLTNLDTDAVHKKSKVDGSALGSFQHTVSAVVQANPSGIMVDGTTLYVFWSNGGTTARFLVCDESAPTVITKVVKTAGTVLHGGEMDTTTHTECYGDSDSLGLVAKFTLLAAVDQTDEVSTEVVDTDLEDELGELALWGNREHDTHPTDPDHPWEARRSTLDLKVITSIAQASETAQRQLDLGSQRRRVLDVGIVGNPALQKTDFLSVVDPVTGISTSFIVDTYRTDQQGHTYLGTIALLPVEEFTDEPTDEGDATVEGS